MSASMQAIAKYVDPAVLPRPEHGLQVSVLSLSCLSSYPWCTLVFQLRSSGTFASVVGDLGAWAKDLTRDLGHPARQFRGQIWSKEFS